MPASFIDVRRARRTLVSSLVCASFCAFASLDAAAANSGALADQTRWIHRVQAQCARAAPERCVIIGRSAPSASPRATSSPVGSATATPQPRSAHSAEAIGRGHATHGR